MSRQTVNEHHMGYDLNIVLGNATYFGQIESPGFVYSGLRLGVGMALFCDHPVPVYGLNIIFGDANPKIVDASEHQLCVGVSLLGSLAGRCERPLRFQRCGSGQRDKGQRSEAT